MFKAELRRFLGISAITETSVCPECLERREVSHQYCHGGQRHSRAQIQAVHLLFYKFINLYKFCIFHLEMRN